MSISISISISPGKSNSFSGENANLVFEQARTWLREQHVEEAKDRREKQRAEHLAAQEKILAERAANPAPRPPRDLAPAAVGVKPGGKGGS